MSNAKLLIAFFCLSSISDSYAGSIEKFDSGAFLNAQKLGKKVVLQFHATWCPTCTRQQDSLSGLAENSKYKGIAFMQADYDKETALKEKFNVKGQSTLIFLKGEVEISRSQGVSDKKKLMEQIDGLAAK